MQRPAADIDAELHRPLPMMRGASASRNGSAGAITKPLAGQQDYVLLGDGAWHSTLPATQLPTPTESAPGGVMALAAVSHKFLTSIGTDGLPVAAQPAAADISGLAASATTDTTNASNIASGTLPAARLPAPAAATLGGIKSFAAEAHKFLTSIGTDGTPAAAQPAAADVSGLAAIATSGSASDIGTGTLNADRLPAAITSAHITGTTTSDNAAAGVVGEYVSATLASGSAVNATSDTSTSVTTISLTAGDWDVEGVVSTLPAGSTVPEYLQVDTNTSAAVQEFAPKWRSAPSAGYVTVGCAATKRYSLSATTTIHLVALTVFSVSTMALYGTIRARRVR